MTINQRQVKKHSRRQGYTEAQRYFDMGEAFGLTADPHYLNHLPEHAIARRAAWVAGFNGADPMGEHHGENR